MNGGENNFTTCDLGEGRDVMFLGLSRIHIAPSVFIYLSWQYLISPRKNQQLSNCNFMLYNVRFGTLILTSIF
jgi:hypothetical protein